MDKNSNNESYNKLLKSYLGLTGFLIGVNQADAQVFYHNIIPDTLLVAPNNCISTYLDFDLNNDGTMDFRFGAKKCLPSFYSYYSTNPPPYTYYGCRSERAWMKEGVSNKMIPDYYTCIANNSTYTGVGQVKRMPQGSIIGNQANFATYGMLKNYDYCTFQAWLTNCGTWNPGISAPIGIKFKINGNDHYGWIRISMLSRSSLKVMDYAYQMQPGAPVAAGSIVDLTTGIPEIVNGITFAVDEQQVIINSEQALESVQLKVIDILGKQVYQDEINGNTFRINLASKGVYVFLLNGKQLDIRRKVFVY